MNVLINIQTNAQILPRHNDDDTIIEVMGRFQHNTQCEKVSLQRPRFLKVGFTLNTNALMGILFSKGNINGLCSNMKACYDWQSVATR